MVAAEFGREEEEMWKNSGSAANCRSCVYMTSRVRSYTRHTRVCVSPSASVINSWNCNSFLPSQTLLVPAIHRLQSRHSCSQQPAPPHLHRVSQHQLRFSSSSLPSPTQKRKAKSFQTEYNAWIVDRDACGETAIAKGLKMRLVSRSLCPLK